MAPPGAPGPTPPRSSQLLGLIPAAGRSRRMGRPKLLLPYGTTTILGATLDALRRGGVHRLLLVRATDDGDLDRWARRHGVEQAVNPRPADGMLSTLLAGLAALAGPGDAAPRHLALMVCPGDLPRLSPRTVAAVLAAARESDRGLVLPVTSGRRGHPLWVAPRLVAEIPHLDPAVGLRGLRLAHPEEVLEVAVDDEGAIRDVDTPDDYHHLR